MALHKDANNNIHDDDDGRALSNPHWPADCTPISDKESELIRQSKLIPLTYQQKRAQLYPPIGDQLDMIYHDNINGTTIWRDSITNIKISIPKI